MVVPVHDEDDLETGFRPWVVWLLLTLNVLIFLYLYVLPDEIVQWFAVQFGLVPVFVLKGAGETGIEFVIPPAFTLLTYLFIHASWLHLAANMLFLWVFGDNIEMALGHLRFIVFYLVAGVAGGLAHIAANSASLSPLIGASAAIAGIVGAYVLLHPRARVTLLVMGIITVTVRAYWLFAIWLAWQIANALVPLSATEIAYWSHIGGFFAGVLMMVLLRKAGVFLPWLGR